MWGVLNLYKPAGWSSRDAVNRVQRLVRPAKVGHAGTLDPIAEGVLVACVGAATRLVEYVQAMPKEYRATFLLGRRSPSDDTETPVELIHGAPEPTADDLAAALLRFTGRIRQRPPAYSALKIEGQRAYRMARRGEAIEIPLRDVEIYRLEIERYDYPELTLVLCSSGGTYVRTLGRDLAEALGTAAVMTALVRRAVGAFRSEAAHDPRELTADSLGRHLLSPLAAVADLQRVELSLEQVERLRRGGMLPLAASGAQLGHALAGVASCGELVAILKEGQPGLWRPSPNFLQPARPGSADC